MRADAARQPPFWIVKHRMGIRVVYKVESCETKKKLAFGHFGDPGYDSIFEFWRGDIRGRRHSERQALIYVTMEAPVT